MGDATVSLSLDDSGARQKLDSFRADLQSIVSGGFNVPMGAAPSPGSVTPMAGPSAIASGIGSYLAVGGAMGAQRLEVDTSQAQSAIQALRTQVTELTAALESFRVASGSIASRAATSIGASVQRNVVEPYEVNDFSGGGEFLLRPLQPHQLSRATVAPGPSVVAPAESDDTILALQNALGAGGGLPGRTGGGGGGGRGFPSNLNPFSARGLARLTGNAMAVYGGLAALDLFGGLADAASEGGLIRQQITRQNDSLGGMVNPADVAGAHIANRAGLQMRSDAIESIERIPLLGHVISAFDFGKIERQEEMAIADRRISMAVTLPQVAMDADISQARAAGNPVRAAQLSAQKDRMVAGENLRRVYQTFGNQFDSPEAQEGRDILRRTVSAGRFDVARAEGELAAMPFDVEARNALRTHDFGGAVKSLQFEARATGERHAAELEAANLNFLHAKDKLFQTRTLGADGKYYNVYTGSRSDMDAFHEAESDRNAVNRRQRLEDVELEGRQADLSFQADFSGRTALARVRSLNARAGNDSFGASMIQFESEAETARQSAAQLGVDLRPAIAAERGIRERRHQFELQVANEGYDARVASANDQMALRPLTASADLEVASARREIAGASPEERAKAIAAQTSELRARQFLLTAQRGGLTAIDMSAHEAMGLMSSRGIDLTGRQLDIRHASQKYESGIAGLANAPNAASTQVSDPSLLSLVGQIYKWLQQQKGVTKQFP